MKKNSVAKRIAAALAAVLVACAVACAPAAALAETVYVTYAGGPAVYVYSWPDAYDDAVSVALGNAGLDVADADSMSVSCITSDRFPEPVVEVAFDAFGLHYDYLVGLYTNNLYIV